MDALRRGGVRRDTLLVSILAGVTIARFEQLLDVPTPWVRAMPNTPCVVGAGMTVVAPGTHATDTHLQLAERIFSSVGRCRIVDESYCNAVTALSGSGPAYMYLMMEAMADAGVRVGLPRDLALQLVAQTMLGSARMVLETGPAPGVIARRRDDAGRLHDRRRADARRRQDPLGAGPRRRRSHPHRRAAGQAWEVTPNA